MNRGLQLFYLLLAWLLLMPAFDVSGQGRDGGTDIKTSLPLLKGMNGTIQDVDNFYCSNQGADTIYIDPADVPAWADTLVWEVFTVEGAGYDEVNHNGEDGETKWFDHIGNGTGTGIIFFPDSVEDKYLEVSAAIGFRATARQGGSLTTEPITDESKVYGSATPYPFGSDSTICNSGSAILTLEQTQSAYRYTLLIDNGSGFSPVSGYSNIQIFDGDPINFTVTQAGIYAVEAVRNDSPSCATYMDGFPEVTVYPDPVPDPQSNGPVCQNEDIVLTDGNPLNIDYTYIWYGDGLPPEGETAYSVTISDNSVIGTAGDYTYDLTIIDNSTSTSCDSTVSVTVTVNENPTVNPTVVPPEVCLGDPITINANANNGSGTYTYNWSTADNASFNPPDHLSDSGIDIPAATLDDNGDVYSVYVEDANNCTSQIVDADPLVVHDNPTVTITPSDTTVCEEGVVTFSADIGSDFTYQWYDASNTLLGTGTSLTLGDGGDAPLPPVGDHEISVVVTSNSTSCFAGDTALLTVNEKPEVSIDDPTDVCNGTASFKLTADFDSGEGGFPGDYNINWYKDGTLLTETSEDLTLNNIEEADEATYTVSIEHVSTGCSDSYDHILTVNTIAPTLTVPPGDDVICADENVTFTASGVDADEYRFMLNGAEVRAFNTDNTWSSNTLSNADKVAVEIRDIHGCTDISDAVTMTVNERPSIINPFGNNGPYCEGETIELFSTVTGGDISTSGDYTYSWTAPSGFTSSDEDPTFGPATLAMSQTYTLVATDDNGCDSPQETTTVEVFENPTVIMDPVPAICDDGQFTVTANVTGGSGTYKYSWEFTPDGGGPVVSLPYNGNTFTVDPADLSDAGSYEVTVTDTGRPTDCTSTGSVAVVVNENPTVVLPDEATCDGQDVTLTAMPSDGSGNYVNYVWYDGGGTEFTGENSSELVLTGSHVALTNNDATYSVTVDDNNGCISAPDTMTLTVNENPAITINTGDPVVGVCPGVDLVLDANVTTGSGSYDPANIVWTLPDGTNPTDPQITIPEADVVQDDVYSVTIIDDLSCEASANVQVNIYPVNPGLDVDPGTSICAGTPVTFTASGGVSYEFFHYDADAGGGTWSSVHGPAANKEWSPVDLNSIEDEDRVYAEVETSDGCFVNSSEIEMTVFEIPTVTLSFTSGTNEVCENESLDVTASGSYSSYDYYVVHQPAEDTVRISPEDYSGTSFTYPAGSIDDGDDIFVVAGNGVGCEANSNTEPIVVHGLPTADITNLTGPPVCGYGDAGSDITLQGEPDSMLEYHWMFDGNTIERGPSRQHVISAATVDSAGLYTLIVTNPDGCMDTATIDVEVYSVPVIDIDLGDEYTDCEGSDIDLNTTITGGNAPFNPYEWELDGSVISGFSTSPYSITNADPSADSGEYTVRVEDDNGCLSDWDTIQVTVDPSPTVGFNMTNTTNEDCEGEQIKLSAAGANGAESGTDIYDYRYDWNHEGVAITGVSIPTYTFTGVNGDNDGTYEVVAIDDNGNGCSSQPVSINVTVHEPPVATLDYDPEFFIEGTSVEFTAGDGSDEYTFFVNGSIEQPRSPDNTYETSSLADGDSVSVDVISSFECLNSDYTIMSVFESVDKPEVVVSNATYCEGSGGASVLITNPQQYVSYELQLENGDPTSFADQTYDGSDPVRWDSVLDENAPAGTNYRVRAYHDVLTPDGDQLSDAFEIIEEPLPAVHTVTVDGIPIPNDSVVVDCNPGTGYEVGLSNTWGSDEYVLLLDGTQGLDTLSGGPVPLSFGNFPYVGTYSIKAIGANGCERFMEGTFTVQGDEIEQYDLLPLDGRYCEGSSGVDLSLSDSENGVDYELFRYDNVSLTTETGNGNAISFGNYSIDGNYYVEVLSPSGCLYRMNNDVNLVEVPSPEAGVLTATDDGHYCEGETGVVITLEISQENGILYELINVDTGVVLDDSLGVTGGGDIQFNNNGNSSFPDEAEYQVRANNPDAGCEAFSNSITIEIDPMPLAYPVIISQEKCGPAAQAIIQVESSEPDVEYRWANSTDQGAWKQGDGTSVEFTVFDADDYEIEARRTGTDTGCTGIMENSVKVEERPLPLTDRDVYERPGTGSGCDDGLVIGIADPEPGYTYQLFSYNIAGDPVYIDDQVVTPVSGDSVDFDPVVDVDETYYIEVRTEYGCAAELDESVYVDVPGAMKKYYMSPEDGDICNGDPGISFELEGSDAGVDYALVLMGETVAENDTIEIIAGDGNPLTFMEVLEEGTYFVAGIIAEGDPCNNEMLNRVDLNVRPLPKAFNMIGPGTYCDGNGANLGIDNSENGMTYILQQHTNLGKRIIQRKDSEAEGDTLRFSPVFDESTYSVVALSNYGCTSSMKDSIEVTVGTAPDQPIVSSPLNYCSIDGGVFIEPSNAVAGVTYQVFDSGNTLMAEEEAESNNIALGPFTDGAYLVYATRESGACTSAPSDTVRIIESVQPIYNGGLNDYDPRPCNGTAGLISYDISEDDGFNWNYQLVDGSEVYQPSLSPGGDSVQWQVYESGTYHVEILTPGGACTSEFSGKIVMDFSDEVPTPVFNLSDIGFCHDESFTDIEIVGPLGDSYLYHLYDENGKRVSTEYGGVSSPSFDAIGSGTYYARTEELRSECLSGPTEDLVVTSHLNTNDFSDIFWFDIIGDQEEVLYMNGGSYSLDVDLSELNPSYEYVVISDSADYSYPLENNGYFEIDEPADDYQLATIYNEGCPPFAFTEVKGIRAQGIKAHDLYIYLGEGKTSGKDTVKTESTAIDIGLLDYSFRLSEDTVLSLDLTGDFRIHPDSGIVVFNKAPSFFGSDRVQYIVENRNYPGRVDTAYIWVYAGNNNLTDDKSIFIPNAFSPNDDGRNDYFEISANRSQTEESTLEVYNRWGTLVYRSDGKKYQNDWDGTGNVSNMVSIGDDLPNGVYFYVYTIRANVSDDDGENSRIVNKKFNGFIELRR